MKRAFVVVAFVTLVCSFALVKPEAQSAPLFTAGQKYIVAWDCWPAEIAMGAGARNPCYSELLHIQGVRKDGWVVVQDEHGDDWTMNPNRALAFKLVKPPLVASR